jgi:hypothetical protein
MPQSFLIVAALSCGKIASVEPIVLVSLLCVLGILALKAKPLAQGKQIPASVRPAAKPYLKRRSSK